MSLSTSPAKTPDELQPLLPTSALRSRFSPLQRTLENRIVQPIEHLFSHNESVVFSLSNNAFLRTVMKVPETLLSLGMNPASTLGMMSTHTHATDPPVQELYLSDGQVCVCADKTSMSRLSVREEKYVDMVTYRYSTKRGEDAGIPVLVTGDIHGERQERMADWQEKVANSREDLCGRKASMWSRGVATMSALGVQGELSQYQDFWAKLWKEV
jgi:hypothetical protein